MNKIDALRCELKCREMVEGTGLEWWQVVKFLGGGWSYDRTPDFSSNENDYEFALGVVEGKPVWKGDELYFHSGSFFEKKPTKVSTANIPFTKGCWSWNPPKPKTIMVELPIETVEWIALTHANKAGDICRKALEYAECK